MELTLVLVSIFKYTINLLLAILCPESTILKGIEVSNIDVMSSILS